MFKYIVIEYEGYHSLSRTEREVVNYEYSNDLKYLKDKYGLIIINNKFSFITEYGFNQYHMGGDRGMLLFDIDTFNSIDNIFKRNIETTLIKAIRDIKIKSLIKDQ
jgi:hypothetical protein